VQLVYKDPRTKEKRATLALQATLALRATLATRVQNIREKQDPWEAQARLAFLEMWAKQVL
jgi:hypothetical protein